MSLTSTATVNGSQISIKVVDGTVTLNDTVKVTQADIVASNG
ncbi:MAG: hypothetical protein U0263_39130 [Polyangiaceae bacterium]